MIDYIMGALIILAVAFGITLMSVAIILFSPTYNRVMIKIHEKICKIWN